MKFVHKIACGNEGAIPDRLLKPRYARWLKELKGRMVRGEIASGAAAWEAGLVKTV